MKIDTGRLRHGIIQARNVHQAFSVAMHHIGDSGVTRNSRNGPVLMSPFPVTTVYEKPTERVLFHPWRDANPFFHFYESLWMLAGRRDVAPLVRYVKRMATFSDDAQIFNAAYGYRWRHATKLDIDQLKIIADNLRENPEDRRQVLQIWAIKHDLNSKSRDVACNTVATFQIDHEYSLNLVVFCRSNDIIWGCYGANAVHFSMLLEYMARAIGHGVGIGTYTQISVNWHAYREVYDKMYGTQLKFPFAEDDPYSLGDVSPYPLMSTSQKAWDEDVKTFIKADGRVRVADYVDPFFKDVAIPVVQAHDIYKDEIGIERFQTALEVLSTCKADDWRLACTQWLERRLKKEQEDA